MKLTGKINYYFEYPWKILEIKEWQKESLVL